MVICCGRVRSRSLVDGEHNLTLTQFIKRPATATPVRAMAGAGSIQNGAHQRGIRYPQGVARGKSGALSVAPAGGGCGFARHTPYARVTPHGTRIARSNTLSSSGDIFPNIDALAMFPS